jgi:hypothetical protein
MKKSSIVLTSFVSIVASILVGCSNSSNFTGGAVKANPSSETGLRPLQTQELVQDFAQEIQLFKSYYGPYNYKQDRFSFNIDALATQLSAKIAAAKTEDEALGYMYQFGANLHDGHVQIKHSLSSSWISKYSLPFGVTAVEGKALVAVVNKDQLKDANIAVGDELVTLDGKTPNEYLAILLKYRSWATDESNKHMIAYITSRPSFATEVKPPKETATAVFKKANGTVNQVEIPWTVVKYNPKEADYYKPGMELLAAGVDDFNEALQNSIFEMGSVKPFFGSDNVKQKYKWVEVYASDTARADAGLGKDEKPPVYSAIYRFQGKTILLVRSSSYAPSDYSAEVYLKYYKAIMKEYESVADVLVVDQTHNPGGNGEYCTNLASMLLTGGTNNAPVQMCNADRKWIDDFIHESASDPKNENPNMTRLTVAAAHSIEKAYDEGKKLSEALPIFTGGFKLTPFGGYSWKKPKLVLIDELAGSCGDVFPMILRDNKATKFFGQTTMGLGGNVEEVGTLNNSRISIKVTRGLFMTYKESNKYDAADYIENNGVRPDYPYTHTVDDFRSGFVGYVQKFSEKAIEQIN